MSKRDFLSISHLSAQELQQLLDSAAEAKKNPSKLAGALAGKQVALIFEKPSTRTRVSFEAAISTMGGHAIVLRSEELQLGRGETIEDTGRVLSRYVDAIVLRTFRQNRLEQLAEAATVPVINALSDFSHPCQCLADFQTIIEQKGELSGRALAYLGDGNNVVHSLLFGGSKMGMDVRVATPSGYAPDWGVVERAQETAAETGGRVTVTEVVAEAVVGADVLYTDVWASMGQEEEAAARRQAFEHYQLNGEVLAMAKDDAIVMHCLPAHRGEEITDEVLDGPQSVVWDQAENRLHSQKALLAWLLT
ncbi:MAG TPA: ornithine carbamoyltransferase [Actinomycetota bacterium]|nr:ornithine carbamoyltransferase [Actinomycetota bacterium]